ncbi:hypothetical protein HQ587_03910 [bacterium]|nr:hypothetical protein [bacterium]
MLMHKWTTFFNRTCIAITSIALFTLAGCDWDPPHDNIFDPDNPSYQPLGSLTFKVLTFDLPSQPIANATVLLPELGRLWTTDQTGEASFSELPEGKWWVIAYRDVIPDTAYGRDSIRVTIEQAMTTLYSLRLDALPSFTETRVNSITIGSKDHEGSTSIDILARLTARVHDPDGIADLDRVEWRIPGYPPDTLEHYDPDLLYWWDEVPSEEFPGQNLVNTLTLPFTFEAFDRSGNSSQSIAYLARVISNIPYGMRVIPPIDRLPKLEWYFSRRSYFPNDTCFVYLVKIFREESIEYEKEVAHTNIGIDVQHTVEDSLGYGWHDWEIWVVDTFGNQARSLRERFLIEFE